MFCRGCGYDLRTLGAGKCPECGRAFDPANGRTFFAKKPRLGLRRWMKRVGIVAAVLLLIAGGLGTWFMVWRGRMVAEWEREKQIETRLRANGDVCEWKELKTNSWLRAALNQPACLSRIYRVRVIRALDIDKTRRLALLPHLSEADFSGATCESGALQGLRGKLSLRVLHLPKDSSVVDIAGLELGELRLLEDLRIGATTDAGLAGIEKLVNLKTLSISGRGVTDRGAATVTNLTRLEALHLSFTGISDRTMQAVEPLTALRTLDVRGCRGVTDDGIRHLSNMKYLEVLDLADTGFTDQGVRSLFALERLRSLDLRGTGVSDLCIQDLSLMKSIRWVALDLKIPDRHGFSKSGILSLRALRPEMTVDVIGFRGP